MSGRPRVSRYGGIALCFCMPFHLYILKSQPTGKYYIGTTGDIEDRLHRHNSGRSKYTKHGIPWELVCKEEYTTRSEAMRREKQLKGWKNKDRLDSLVRTSRQGWKQLESMANSFESTAQLFQDSQEKY